MTPLALHLPPETLEQLARRVAEILRQSQPASDPVREYLTVDETAALMRCSRQRVYDLSSQGRLKTHKDGARSLFRPADVQAYLERGGGS